eukprot:GFUD01023543.1.p1 GENE.GFUD01023543.1~~GFUD01023543.1.p1  ORF type:complete len:292 (+),score=99.40 GFUD01023543.1:312-1187(+)
MSWNSDESGNAVASGGEVKHGGAVGSEKKGNAMWMEDNSGEGVQCWNFDITGGKGMWVGVGTQENFGSGYKLKGLMYGGPGNLSDGGALVTGHWGPKFGEGDKIGMRIEISGDRTTLAFSKNGVGLGVAYDISGWTGSPLRPVVSLDSADQSVVISSMAVCSLETMAPASGPPAGVAGSWQHDKEQKCQLSIEAEEAGQWRVGAKVGNSMSCIVTENSGVFSAGPVMSTMMMPPPELQTLETSVEQLLSGITNIAREGDKLVVTAGDRSEKFCVAPGSTPATKDRVRWMNK